MRRIALLSLMLVAAAFVVTAGAQRSSVIWPTLTWPRATPESQGLSTAHLKAFDLRVEEGDFGNVDQVVVVRNGRLVFNKRYARDYQEISRGKTGPVGCGEGCTDPTWMHDFNYYHPTYHPYYLGSDVHTLQSITKSIAATVIGIALGRRELKSLDVPMLDFFSDRFLQNADPRLYKVTVRDLLTMRSGIEWHEQDRPRDDTNTTVQLEKSQDWIDFTLAQPMDADPDTKWAYNSGGSMLLSGIIAKATRQHIDRYASRYLFGPLGIKDKDFYWKKTPTGHPDTEGGLYLGATDLAKIGYLYLHDGMWAGRRILPQGWVDDATKPHHGPDEAPGPVWGYGYQWWMTKRQDLDVWAGRGFGGQYLIVIPSRQIVGVINAWNVFGGHAMDTFNPFVEALLAAK